MEDGLAQDQVQCMFQDSKGYVWIGTNGAGVNRFDGHKMGVFTTNDGLVNNRINMITEDGFGNIWIGTGNGISKFDGTQFHNYTTKHGLIANEISEIFVDDKQTLWVGSGNNGVICTMDISEKDGVGKSFKRVNFESLDNQSITMIGQDKNLNLWIGTNIGLIKCEPNKDIRTEFDLYTVDDGLPNNLVSYILHASSGKIWFGTNEGICVYNEEEQPYFSVHELNVEIPCYGLIEDKTGQIWYTSFDAGVRVIKDGEYNHLKEEQGLLSHHVFSLMCDHEGNVWIGTYGDGVSVYTGKLFELYSKRNGLGDDFIWALHTDSRGNIWSGSDIGGASFFDGQKFTNFNYENGLGSNRARAILEDNQGNIWVGTEKVAIYSGGVAVLSKADFVKGDYTFKNYTIADGLSHNSVYSIFQDKQDNLWFGTMNGVTKYDGKEFKTITSADGFTNNRVYAITEDNQGNIWFGTGGGGLIKYFPKKKSGQKIQTITTADGLASNDIRTIIQDTIGNLWIGTGGGISIYNGITFRNITTKHGLSSDRLYLMIFDDDYLWLGSNVGVDRLDYKRYMKTGKITIKNYGFLEGFIGVETNTNAVCKDTSGNILFGTIRGIVKYNPKEDVAKFTEPLMRMVELRLNGDMISFETGKQFEYDQNNLTFEYIGITYQTPEKVNYQYMLDGFDSKWSYVTKETYVSYSNLPPGEFTFKVRSSIGDELWSPSPVEHHFVIFPPFWQTWWFYILSVLVTFGGIFTIVKWREKRLHRIRHMLEKKVKERTQELNEKNDKLELITIELQRSNKALEEFAYVASHDLKEPLRKIRVFGERLAMSIENSLRGKDKEYMTKMNDAASRMKNLIDSLLMYSRVSTRRSPYEPTNLNEVVQGVLSDLEISIKESKGKVEVQDLPVIEADKLQMQQLFQNLISNALKFRKKDVPPEVTVTCTSGQNGDCKFFVKDNGVGFNVQYLDKLFKPFYRLHGKYEYEGTGIGSSICQKIVERHGGDITAESTEGAGTIFIVTLPLKQKEKF